MKYLPWVATVVLLLALPLCADSISDVNAPLAVTSSALNTVDYSLAGGLEGTPGNAPAVYSSTVQLSPKAAIGSLAGRVPLRSGAANFVVPEPGSLSLLGAGLLGLAMIIRHKLQPPGHSG
ncbi:MAG TPA: PEP-CTERM sorting domain-containing protein [Candidatus Sulfotelmatobacter sp.]|nr:PEP-CTERM sorting domain-containing protein [Candidatus Sulfotelmatobacter sp.]